MDIMKTASTAQIVNVKAPINLIFLPAEVKEATVGDRKFTRHVNKNGTTGGFVESTARATEFTTIGMGSLVLDRAIVRDVARIESGTVMENATVSECARIQVGAIIRGDARVSSDTEGNTFITENGETKTLFNGNSLGVLGYLKR